MNEISVPAGARLVDFFGRFALYALAPRPEDSPLWPAFKLMTDPEAPRRWGQQRVYRLTWGVDARRFRRDAQSRALQDNEPETYSEIEKYMRASYGLAWALSREGLGLTADELEAERQRLRSLSRRPKPI